MPSSYPLDTTGLSPGNLVSNEIHTLTEINTAPYRILIPTFAPFYLDNFTLTHISSTGVSTNLIADSDFYLCLPYIGASRSIGKFVYGGITINDSIINGTIKVTYQTIGGDWTADAAYVRERLIEKVYNPRLTIWDIVTDKPDQFPPTAHTQPADTIYGQQELIASLDRIAAQITAGALAPSNNAMSAALHPARKDNPHEVTKAQVGLGDVENLPLATPDDITNRNHVPKYVTLGQVMDLEQNRMFTKADIGLGNVDNTSDVNKPVSTAQQTAIFDARNVAITTAASDATTKAATAQAAAIAAAASDATAKANAAENAAKTASTPAAHIGSTGIAHGNASVTVAGFMSAADKAKLDSISGNNSGDQTTITGNAGTASKLQNARTITATGDAAWVTTFDGSTDVSATLTLSNTGVASGTYTKVTVDAKGRVVGNATLAAADIPVLDAAKITTGILTRDTSGNSATATKLLTTRSISLTGDGSWSINFDGSLNASSVFTLADTGVSPGQFTKVTVDSKGRVTSATNVTAADIPALDASKITTGTLSVPTSANAATATRLATPRTINGVAFDGSANVTLNAVDSTARIAVTEKGIPNGVATLDATGLIPSSQLPSYVDDVVEFNNFAALPLTGETSKIYVTTDNNRTYRWTGSSYIEISPTTGTSDAAIKLATPRTIALTGDGAWNVSFDGSTNVTSSLTLSDTGVAGGTYPKVTVDSKGRVTAGVALSATDIPVLDAAKITTGTLSVPTTANAGTATKLAVARTINGVAFDGTANITINAEDSTPRIAVTEKGVANGVASLDANGLIHTTQLPAFLDDVIEAASLAAFPVVGAQGIIYIALDTNNIYRWSGSAYISLTTPPVKTRYMTAASLYIARG